MIKVDTFGFNMNRLSGRCDVGPNHLNSSSIQKKNQNLERKKKEYSKDLLSLKALKTVPVVWRVSF